MAYKPKNVAKFVDKSTTYSPGSAMGRGPAMVPGATGSDDRESQLNDFIGNGSEAHGSGDYSFFGGDGRNDDTSNRGRENFGTASYNYNQPTL